MGEPVRAAVLAACALLLTGCSSAIAGSAGPITVTDADRQLVTGYFSALNTAGAEGAAKQHALLEDTQHPDFPQTDCKLPEGTIKVQPTLSTLRLDPDWTPPKGDEHPRGVVLVVAVTLTVVQDGVEIGSQIGSQHVVLLNDKAYGFAPCAK
ncbi:hypothetical protein [Actinosynnema sp. NPDC020468]|uniref:hypothetical protein n=1 Tax=Actinosynnema sp. NPDC020468 TaxID=3154488 RepID=UPI0033E07977